jgi:hypothetical protein
MVSPHLRELYVANCELDAEMVNMILSCLCQNNVADSVLDISENSFDIGNSIGIIELISNAHNLHTLIVKNNNFKSKSDLDMLLKALTANSSLIKVDISCNFSSSNRNADLLKLVAELITTHPTLEILVMCGDDKNHIGKELGNLIPALSTSQISSLDISGNEMGDKEGIALAEVMRQNTTLKSLFWDRNSIR